MPFEYVSVDEAIARRGLRMVVVGGVPSPWGEAAKGILYIKRLDWVAVRLAYDSEPLRPWAGQRSGPIAIYDNEPPRAGWAEILLLAERLAPEPALVPSDALARAQLFGLAHEICGEEGLGWTLRLLMIHAGRQASPPTPISGYLGGKYGYSREAAAAAPARAVALLRMLSALLAREKARGNGYLLGASVTALDLYFAAFSNLLAPLPPEQLPMPPAARAILTSPPPEVMAALDPALLAHRDFVFAKHVGLPLEL
jgi:glutathione S-transferase